MSAARSLSSREPPTAVGDSWAWIAPNVRPSAPRLGVGQAVELLGELDRVGGRGEADGDLAVALPQRGGDVRLRWA